jgi:DNA-directed RNA polymerase subunit L
MNITILEKKKNTLFFTVGADHTLCNMLKKELWNDKSVTVSGYAKEHMQVGDPKFILEVSSGEPKKALMDAIKRLKKNNATFLKAFNSAK